MFTNFARCAGCHSFDRDIKIDWKMKKASAVALWKLEWSTGACYCLYSAPGLGWSFIFQQDNDPKCTAMLSQEWLQNISVNVLEWLSQRPDLRLINHHLERPENGSPSNPMELVRCCKEEWAKDRCAKLVAPYSKRLDDVIAAKGASTNKWAKAVNICYGVFYVGFWGKTLIHVGMGL